MDFNGDWIVITGASSGLGKEIALQLAERHNSNLILVARRENKLKEIQNTIQRTTSAQVEILVADLCRTTDNQKLLALCLSRNNLAGVILNAGITYFGEHTEITEDRLDAIIDLNINSNTFLISHLTKHYSKTTKDFRLMVVSSMAANFPVSYQALYSGTKGFVTNFANALSHEIDNDRFMLSVFSPGGIKTEMTSGKEFEKLEKHLMSVSAVAKEGIKCFNSNKYNHIPGTLNKIGNYFLQLLPSKPIASLLAKNYRKSLKSSQR